MAMDIPTLRDRLTAALRSGAAPDQLVDLQHGGLRRNFLPFDVDPSDGAFSSNLGGLLEVWGDHDRAIVRGMVLDHMALHSVSFRVVELTVVDRAGADLAQFLISRSADEEGAALGARRTSADRSAAQALFRAFQVARLWLATGHHQLPWDDGSPRKPGATLPVLRVAITRLLTPKHVATPAGQRLMARMPVWLAGGALECQPTADGLVLPESHYVAMVNDLESPIPPMLICNGDGMTTRLLAITG